MGLKLGIDFGTATTCAAVVTDLSRFHADVVHLAGRDDIVNSLVWFERPNGRRSLVPLKGARREPVSLFEAAERDFWNYWARRVQARNKYSDWLAWRNADRETPMLLSYFKPELADVTMPGWVAQPTYTHTWYDPGKQYSDVRTYWSWRRVADPSPDTADMVAGAAAILQRAAEHAYQKFGERISTLAIGIPSIDGRRNPKELARARERREEAIRLADIHRRYGTSDFHVIITGEAMAAAHGLDVESNDKEVLVAVVDVGAGTTDLSLTAYARRGTAWRPAEELLHHSVRIAGRDVNTILAEVLGLEYDLIRKAYRALDDRSWQVLVEQEFEGIKRAIDGNWRTFAIDLKRYCGHWEGCGEDVAKREVLKRVVHASLTWEDDRFHEVWRRAMTPWQQEVNRFITDAGRAVGQGKPRLAAVELVGGAFRFTPLRLLLEECLKAAGFSNAPVRYRDAGGEAQTVVARGLARLAAIQ